MSLQNVQAEFADELFSDDEHTLLAQPAQHISIYRNNMIATLLRTLREIYPMIARLVGDDFFNIAAKEYIHRYPSRSSNLHDYGEYFSDFLSEYPPVKSLIYLIEVAEFEWQCHVLQFSADHVPLDIHRLNEISPEKYEQLHFTLHPASCLKKFHYPIMRIVDLCNDQVEGSIDVNEGGVNLLIIRREFDLEFIPLTIGEFTFLTNLHNNHSLSEALDATLLVDPSFQLDVKLPEWINNKTIVDYHLL